MNYKSIVNAEELREIDAGSIGALLTPIGAPPDNPVFNIYIYNGTDATLVFGWAQKDGLLGRMVLPAGGGITLDFQTNKKGKDGDLNYPAKRAIYVRQEGVPATGKAYLTYFYGED